MDEFDIEQLLSMLPCGDDAEGPSSNFQQLQRFYTNPRNSYSNDSINDPFVPSNELSSFNSFTWGDLTGDLLNKSTFYSSDGNVSSSNRSALLASAVFNADYFSFRQEMNEFCNLTSLMKNDLMGNDVFREIMGKLNIYFTPIIILLGMTGNILSFLVFTVTHVKRQSSSVYLASLAVVDILFLACLLIVWLSWIKIPLLHRNGWCQLTVYVQYVTTFLSVYLVTAFTVERYIIVNHPFMKDKLCTPSKAIKVVIILAAVGAVSYSFSIFTNGIVYVPTHTKMHQFCTPLYSYYNFLTVCTALDCVVTLIIPSVAIVSLNISIARKIIKLSHERKSIEAVHVLNTSLKKNNVFRGAASDFVLDSHYSNRVSSINGHHSLCDSNLPRRYHTDINQLQHDNNNVGQPLRATPFDGRNLKCSMRIAQSKLKAQSKTVRMLLIVSTVFIVLNIPSHAFRIHAFFQSSVHDRYATKIVALRWHELFQLLYHLHFAINFVLYSLYGTHFRKGLRILWYRITHLCHCQKFRFWQQRQIEKALKITPNVDVAMDKQKTYAPQSAD